MTIEGPPDLLLVSPALPATRRRGGGGAPGRLLPSSERTPVTSAKLRVLAAEPLRYRPFAGPVLAGGYLPVSMSGSGFHCQKLVLNLLQWRPR